MIISNSHCHQRYGSVSVTWNELSSSLMASYRFPSWSLSLFSLPLGWELGEGIHGAKPDVSCRSRMEEEGPMLQQPLRGK